MSGKAMEITQVDNFDVDVSDIIWKAWNFN